MLQFKVYTKDGEAMNTTTTVNIDANNIGEMNELRDMAKRKDTLVAPVCELGAYQLMLGKSKGLDWSAEVVTTVLTEVVAGTAMSSIKFKVFAAHNGLQLSDDAIRKTAKGDANTHQADVDEELRAAAKAKMAESGSGKGRKSSVTDERKAEIAKMIDDGKTGSEIDRELGLSNGTANRYWRQVNGGYRKPGLA